MEEPGVAQRIYPIEGGFPIEQCRTRICHLGSLVCAGSRFMSTKWEGVVRYSDYDSPHDSIDQKQWALGVNYLFSSNAMAKLAYNFNDSESESEANDDRFQVQFAYGF